MSISNRVNIAVIGLGYVGLPLAVEFGKKYQTIGFDINESRVQELKWWFRPDAGSRKRRAAASYSVDMFSEC